MNKQRRISLIVNANFMNRSRDNFTRTYFFGKDPVVAGHRSKGTYHPESYFINYKSFLKIKGEKVNFVMASEKTGDYYYDHCNWRFYGIRDE